MLQKEDLAPINIPLIDLNGNEVTLKDYLARKYLVVYFYPKDDTEACTIEACSVRDYNQSLKDIGVTIVGISKDSVKSHNKFITKFKLNFELLSDPDHKLQEAFGVWGQKSMFGKKYMGTLRTTFLLDKSGRIIYVWENVKAKNHAQEIYNYIKVL